MCIGIMEKIRVVYKSLKTDDCLGVEIRVLFMEIENALGSLYGLVRYDWTGLMAYELTLAASSRLIALLLSLASRNSSRLHPRTFAFSCISSSACPWSKASPFVEVTEACFSSNGPIFLYLLFFLLPSSRLGSTRICILLCSAL